MDDLPKEFQRHLPICRESEGNIRLRGSTEEFEYVLKIANLDSKNDFCDEIKRDALIWARNEGDSPFRWRAEKFD